MTGAVGDTTPPAEVRAIVAPDPCVAVWRNDADGVTYAVGDPVTRYLKWQPDHPEVSLTAEAERLRWAARHVRVPEVLAQASFSSPDGTVAWMLTRAIDATSAVADRWSAAGAVAARAVGDGLRRLHESLPVDECPWEWSPSVRIDDARRRGIAVPDDLLTWPAEDRVVCHGDACCPNTLLGDDGRAVAHVDLGALGVGDRWADLAVAAMSTVWNFGPGLEDEVYAGYGVPPDPTRIEYYRRLWNAT